MRLRFLLIVLLTLAVISSCKESVERGNGRSATVGFATKFSGLSDTRSIIGSPGQLATAGGFNVWGYEHLGSWASASSKTALFNGTAVTSSDGSAWTYGTPILWPETSNVSFFAYGPAGAAEYTGTEGELPEITFTVASTLEEQKDLMIATQRPDQFGPEYADDPLVLTFNHALSQIKFSASLVGTFAEETIKITRIELRNLHNSGTTTLQTPIAWTLGSGRADYALTISEGLNDVNLKPAPSSADITPSDGGLMLMPQLINRPDDPVELYVEITLDGVTIDYTVPLFSPTEWLPGKSYKYHISIDKDAVQVIVIDSDITLVQWTGSVILQTVVLTSDEERDENVITDAIKTLNAANNGTTTNNYTHFGIYGVNDMDHDIFLDIGALEPHLSKFASGQHLMFDFKKMIRNWNISVEGDPWRLYVYNFEAKWDLAASWQHPWSHEPAYSEVDATTGATLPADYPTSSGDVRVEPWYAIEAKGSIILRRK